MRKYYVIFKATLMSNLQYITNIVANAVGYFIHIFIFIQIWNYMYDNPANLIKGYSKGQMIWYIIITEIIVCCGAGRSNVRQIYNDVRSGNVAYNINKPYSYIGYILFNTLGSTTIRMVTLSTIGFVLGIVSLNSFPELSLIQGLVVLISFFLAVVINILLVTFTGLLSFIMEDSNPIYWIYSKIILLLGTFFPIEFFPDYLQTFIAFSPVYAVCYGPAKLFIDFDFNFAITTLVAQVVYVFFSLGLCKLIYMRGVRKLNVNGG